jgi:glycosyltransferase involved in cell wall biosynthesis
MRVALVTSLARGGPVEQALVLTRALAGDGADVRVVCPAAEPAARFADAGARVAVIPLRHPGDARNAVRVWRFTAGADVVHAQDRRAGLWVRLGPRPRRGGLRIHTVHGLPEPFHPPPVGPARPGPRALVAYRGLDAALARRADATIVPSRVVAGELVRRQGYPRARLRIVPNGVELRPPPARRGELVATLSLLEPVKGLDVFLRAVARLAPGRPDVRFAMFGSGPEAAALARLAAELGLDGRVSRPGFVPAPEALARMRVLVLPSYVENHPMAMLEAMAAGVPVVATAVYGVPEIADDATAWLVPPGDPAALATAIARVLDDPAEAAARARAARERVARTFSADANLRATVALYRELLG